MNINSIANKIPNSVKKAVSKISRHHALLPVILLEACVTGGRTYHAYKRDGFIEARERLTEESLGALFWFGGVKFFNKLGDGVGKKFLNLNQIAFDSTKDSVRKPMKNYIYRIVRASKMAFKSGKTTKIINNKTLENTLSKFKIGKILSSVLLANLCIGFAVPKMNQKITKQYLNSVHNLSHTHPELSKGGDTMDDFIQKTNKNSPNVSFKGLGSMQNILAFANKFETNPTYQLLSVDVGVAGGRAVNARNKHERIEVLFRDISSLYFYMFCKKHIDAVLNQIEDKRTTRLDPLSAHELHETFSKKWAEETKKTGDDFKRFAFGDESKVPTKLNFKFNKDRITSLNDFIRKCPEKADLAERMSRLQPQIKGVSILTEAQVKDIYREGMLNNPEFLSRLFNQSLGKNLEKPEGFALKIKEIVVKLIGKRPQKPDPIVDPFKFVSQKELLGLKNDAKDYLTDIIKKVGKDGIVTSEVLETAMNSNLLKSTLNLGIGFAVSAYFLSTVIPKVQYWITQKRTGENKFPGTAEYKK